MNYLEVLRDIGAPELTTGWAVGWRGRSMCPYSDEELIVFGNGDSDDDVRMRQEFNVFKEKLASLPEADRSSLRAWVHSEFVVKMWGVTRNIERPEFARDRFFCNAQKRGRMLDIAPAHGCHGALIYRDRFKYELDLHVCDILPAYNKLLAVLGAKVEHLDVRYGRLASVYAEGQFDVITLTEVLEHVVEHAEDAICLDLATILRPSGRLLITFPEVALPNGVTSDHPLGHVRQPTLASVKGKLVGFRHLEEGMFFSGKVNQVFLISERT